MRAEQAFDSLDIFLLCEAGEVIQIAQRLIQHSDTKAKGKKGNHPSPLSISIQ